MENELEKIEIDRYSNINKNQEISRSMDEVSKSDIVMTIPGCRLEAGKDSVFIILPTSSVSSLSNKRLQFSRNEAREILKDILYSQ